MTEEDLYLNDYPMTGPSTLPHDGTVLAEPTPAPAQTKPLLEDLLERDDHTELRRRLLVALVTERILQNNTDAVTTGQLDNVRARNIADACVAQAANTPGMKSADCGRPDLPMFVAGESDYPQATGHVQRALEYNRQWYLLRYYQRPDPERKWKLKYPETDDPDGQPSSCKRDRSTAGSDSHSL